MLVGHRELNGDPEWCPDSGEFNDLGCWDNVYDLSLLSDVYGKI